MTRAIFWKEWREQGSVVLTLLAAGLGLLVAANILLEGPSAESVTRLRSLWFGGRVALLLMTITTGLVIGASLFAAERETGTFTFLDLLPGSRWSRWWRKVLVGLVLIIGPITAYLGLATALGMLGNLDALLGWYLFTFVLAVASYGWGCFGSVFGKTSMAACGIGLAGAGAASIVAVLGTSLLVMLNRHVFRLYANSPGETIAQSLLVGFFILFFLPLFLSALSFTAADRGKKLRSADIMLPTLGEVQYRLVQQVRRSTRIRWITAWPKLVWLAWRQFRWQLVVTGGLGVLLGSVLLIPEVSPAIIYPVPSLLLGVIVGVTTWTDEQSGQSLRFWSERRLPLGRLWRMKFLTGLGLLIVGTVVLLGPLMVKALLTSRRGDSLFGHAFNNGLATDESFPFVQHLLIWPMYGFAFGSLFGLLFRKGIVAGAVSLMVGGVFAGFWFPSFIMGGVSPLLWLIPLAIVLLLSRALVWPSAQERLAQRGPLLRFALAAAGLLISVGIGLTSRAYSIPETSETDADLKFAEAIPSYDLDQPGRDLRRVIPAIDSLRQNDSAPAEPLFQTNHQLLDDGEFQQLWDGHSQPMTARGLGNNRYFPQLIAVLARGYPQGQPRFDEWLSNQCETSDEAEGKKVPAEWERILEEASKKPVGVLDDPTEVVLGAPLRYVGKLEMAFRLYLVRGLQLQQQGQPDAYLHRLAITMQLMRTVRNKTFQRMVHSAYQIETEALIGLDRWLEQLDGRPDLLRRAIQILEDRERFPEPSLMDCQLAMQTMIRQNYRTPSQWLPMQLEQRRRPRPGMANWTDVHTSSPSTEMEVAALNFAVLLPWEQERLRRLIGLGNASQNGSPAVSFQLYSQLPSGPDCWGYFPRERDFWNQQRLTTAIRRASLLKCAIRVFQHEKQNAPATLTELIGANILTQIPTDPFDPNGADFRYRRSNGEKLNQPESLTQASVISARIRARQGTVLPGGGVGAAAELPRRRVSEFYPLSAVLGVPIPAIECDWHPMISPKSAEIEKRELSRNRLVIAKNQGLLWSVGPNLTDENGETTILDDLFHYREPFGDVVFPVPRPPERIK